MGARLTTSRHLFDDFVRTDDSPCGHAENEFGFLNRTSWSPFVNVRHEIERWFAETPARSNADLVARARGDDQSWASVFWELYLHRLLRRAGFGVEVHPELPDVTTHVDFLATRGGFSLAVEATTVLGSKAEKKAQQRRNSLRAALDKLHSSNFSLGIYIVNEGDSDLAIARHRRELETWLASLDPDSIDDHSPELGDESFPTIPITEDGWDLEVVAYPRAKDDRDQPGSPVSVFGSGEAKLIDDVTPLRRTLRSKGSRYGELGVPFVLAVLLLGHFANERDVMSALFGTSAIQYTQRLRKEDPPPWARWIRLDDGYFLRSTGPLHPGVSALVVAQGLHPWTVGDVSPVLWHHPAPERPLGNVLPIPSVSLQLPTGNPWRETAVVSINEALGVPPGWPGFSAERRTV